MFLLSEPCHDSSQQIVLSVFGFTTVITSYAPGELEWAAVSVDRIYKHPQFFSVSQYRCQAFFSPKF